MLRLDKRSRGGSAQGQKEQPRWTSYVVGAGRVVRRIEVGGGVQVTSGGGGEVIVTGQARGGAANLGATGVHHRITEAEQRTACSDGGARQRTGDLKNAFGGCGSGAAAALPGSKQRVAA